MSTSLDATTVQGAVCCDHCDSPLHLACPKCGPGAEYHVAPLRKYRPPPTGEPYKGRPVRFTKTPCITCGKPVEITGKGRPHQRCVKCRGLA